MLIEAESGVDHSHRERTAPEGGRKPPRQMVNREIPPRRLRADSRFHETTTGATAATGGKTNLVNSAQTFDGSLSGEGEPLRVPAWSGELCGHGSVPCCPAASGPPRSERPVRRRESNLSPPRVDAPFGIADRRRSGPRPARPPDGTVRFGFRREVRRGSAVRSGRSSPFWRFPCSSFPWVGSVRRSFGCGKLSATPGRPGPDCQGIERAAHHSSLPTKGEQTQ